MRLGVVSGLASESACLRVLPADLRRSPRCCGMGPEAAEAASLALVAEGCTALLSFGLAGGLDPRLRPGDVVLAEAVVDGAGGRWVVGGDWHRRLGDRLRAAGVPFTSAPILGSDRPLTRAADKQAAAVRHAASAVDMESHVVARVAMRAGLPFLIVRSIADSADEAVPGWLAGVIDGAGRPRLGRVAAGCLTHPGDLGHLLRLARQQRAGLAGLRRVALGGGPLFALG